MNQTRRFLNLFFLAAAMIFSMIGAGCAARARYYDTYYGVWHSWDRGESRAYQQYWYERGKPYREWTDLNQREQRDYWKWRHEHPYRY